MTQTWLADDPASGDRSTYEPVTCLACSQQHFISVSTGRALGDRTEAVTTIRGPAFPPKQLSRGGPIASRDDTGIVPPLDTARSSGGHVKAH
jgi:hypothetical protein